MKTTVRGRGNMYLKKTPNKSGRVSLSAVESYRDESGTKRQRTIKTFGFVDELAAEHADPVAHYEAVVAAMDAEKRNATAATIEINPLEKVDKRQVGRLRRHVGDALACWWLNELGIEATVRNSMRGRKVDYDLNAVLRLLVCERLIAPDSNHSAWENKDRHFFRCEFSDDDVRRALTELGRISDRIVAACNRAIARNTTRDESLVCYYVANHLFECHTNECGPLGKDKSEEHDCSPIVQLGLLQDANDIPISYDLLESDAFNDGTLQDILKKHDDHVRGRVVVVADNEMSFLGNIEGCIARGNGFFFSLPIQGVKLASELEEWVLSEDGYRQSSNGTYRFKSSQRYADVNLRDLGVFDDTTEIPDVEVKLVALRGMGCDERTCCTKDKVAEDPTARLQLDQGAIDVRPGVYHLIVTSETDWNDGRITDTLRKHQSIEKAYRSAETINLVPRPTRGWTDDQVRALVLISFLSQLIVRLTQRALPSHPSEDALLADMRALDCSFAENGWWLFDHRTDLTDEIFALVGETAPRKWMRTQDIKALFQKGKKLS